MSEPSSLNSSLSQSQSAECRICMGRLTQPVLTPCGHMFCWPCIFRWFNQSQTCPMCFAPCSVTDVIPYYDGRTTDVEPGIPPRPSPTQSPRQARNRPLTADSTTVFMGPSLSLSWYGLTFKPCPIEDVYPGYIPPDEDEKKEIDKMVRNEHLKDIFVTLFIIGLVLIFLRKR
ncbi:putative E3 ubiquitin-protein ligase RNF5 [Blattamonas nauphoetae]|uniref:RING-type E3 ubiquitin transferase n=1 Tax=Blattamonas nauphoetae TaxID=2049346 RepID=A0ABQ9YM48_9EUKA|nr:putative E3 ubiquitin-protein ligase RNF5 [Blattamonas nauphoetae]